MEFFDLPEEQQARIREIKIKLQGFPIVGDKITFAGSKPFWLSDIIENEKLLEKGAQYQISAIEVGSSWSKVKLSGFGEKEFSLDSFSYVQRKISDEEKKKLNSEIWEKWPPRGVREYREKIAKNS